MRRWLPGGHIILNMSRGRRRLAGALATAAVLHLALFAVFVVSITNTGSRWSRSDTSYQITLVRLPPATRETVKAPRRERAAPRLKTPIAAPAALHTPPITMPATPSPPAPPNTNPNKSSGDSDVEAMRKALRALAACHSFGVRSTDKERADCEARLRRMADAAPHIDTAPPPQPGEPEQKVNTCRLSLKTLLSPRVKCKIW
ncbi:MAG TPA: hypothetical protein VG407_00295 [Caulobacteraceae bacterium]|jgi:hypothetical protein|nr:hypothetical protein [Caulobacteraceae bacterium]